MTLLDELCKRAKETSDEKVESPFLTRKKMASSLAEDAPQNAQANKSQTTLHTENQEEESTHVDSSLRAITETREDEGKEENKLGTTETKETKEATPKRKKCRQEEPKGEVSESLDILGEKFPFHEVASLVLNHFTDDEWYEKEEYFKTRMEEIKIERDMSSGALKYVLSDLAILYDEVAPFYIEQKQLLQVLTNKDFGIAVAERIIHSRGTNDADRKRTGLKALTESTLGGTSLNYLSLIAAIQIRYTFLESLINRIEYKSKICITMSSALKMEQSLIQ